MSAQGKPRHKIVYTILAVLLAVSLLPMGLLGWWLIKPIRDETTTKEREVLLDKARLISGDIESYVRTQRSNLETSATGLALLMENAGPDQFIDMVHHYDILSRYLGPHREFHGLTLNVGGRSFRSMRREALFEQLGVTSRVEVGSETVLAGRPFFYSQPFFLPRPHQPAMVVTVPLVLDGSRVVGTLSGVLSLTPVVNLVVHEYGSGAYTVYVLDRNQQLVAHSNYQKVKQGFDMGQVELVRRRAKDDMPVGATYEFPQDVDGRDEDMLGAYYPANSVDWTVFIQSEAELAYANVRRMMRTLGLSMLGALVIAVLAAVYFAESLSWPIRHLAAKTRSLAEGDFSQRVEIQSRNELGELADTFNLMSEQIETYIGRLRQALDTNKQLFLGCVRTMAAAIDEKDPYTRGHSERVDRYSLIIARRLGMDEEEMHWLHIGALLHDVGKIGIDDRILKKPSALTQEEFEIMKQHPIKGANIIAPITQLSHIVPILKHHHERYDGTGYPDGLAGEHIPFMARVVTVADTFDAMTTERPYQRAMTFQVAISKMLEFKGKALDPELVDMFVAAWKEGELEPDRREDEERRIRALEDMEPPDAQRLLERAG